MKLYINSQTSSPHIVHLISAENDTFLLDENKKIINIDTNTLNAKYLSDVSFSNNDYVLNTLLNLLPKKIYLHLVSPLSNLDFINTLQLILKIILKFAMIAIFVIYIKKSGIKK